MCRCRALHGRPGRPGRPPPRLVQVLGRRSWAGRALGSWGHGLSLVHHFRS